MFSEVGLVVGIAIGVGAALLIALRRRVSRRPGLGDIDPLLCHLAGGPVPPLFQQDPDVIFAAVDKAADSFFGLDPGETDASLLARFQAAEANGLAPEMLVRELAERCQMPPGSDDVQAQRMIVLSVTRPHATTLLHRTAFHDALAAAAAVPSLLPAFVARTRACMAENPYLYLDLPDGEALRALAGQADDVATRQALLALAQDLQDQALSASREA